MSILLLSIRFHDGRYHGSGEWPPSPARLFQALIAGAARGESLSEQSVEALKWLERLEAPTIATPPAYDGQRFTSFVPNNDLDAVGGDPARIGEVRTGKIIRPRMFDAAIPLLYAWAFESGADAARHAGAICDMADNLYQFGRGVDMAWAQGEVLDEDAAGERLRVHGRVHWRPNQGGDGIALSCPHPGSFESLARRFAAMRGRFKWVREGKKAHLLFSQAPKPNFRQVRYNSRHDLLLFEIRNLDGFVPRPLESVVSLTERIRDLAVMRLKTSAWRRDDPNREALVDRIFIGHQAQDSDKTRRIRITPLPSIGHPQAERSIRRVLVTVPPDCPIVTGDIAWAFSGLVLADPKTGEISDDTAGLVAAGDRTMLKHYGIEDAAPARVWRTVTPAALSERAARRRIDPRRMREEAKGGAERLRENAAAEHAVRQALRHAGIETPVQEIRVQREPFEGRGQRAEAFEAKPRFAKELLWHVAITFAEPVAGPLLIGNGRYLGLGLMSPVKHPDGMFAFAITDGLTDQAEPLGLTRALRRAVMARVRAAADKRWKLTPFFTGHAADGGPLRSGRHEHLSFVFDAPGKRLLIIAPHVLGDRNASKTERDDLRRLEAALRDFQDLRAGAAGRLALVPGSVDPTNDPLCARSCVWESLTPYRVTRHARLKDAAAAFTADLLTECLRAGLPSPRIETVETFGKPGSGLFGRARISFCVAVAGPLLLGRDRHYGGGLFVASD